MSTLTAPAPVTDIESVPRLRALHDAARLYAEYAWCIWEDLGFPRELTACHAATYDAECIAKRLDDAQWRLACASWCWVREPGPPRPSGLARRAPTAAPLRPPDVATYVRATGDRS